MATNYHVLDFDNLNEKGLQPLMRAIKSAGGDVVKLEPAGASRKKDGVPVKTFTLTNVDGQHIELQVNNSGDLSGAKLNGRVYPAGSPTSLRDMALKIVTAFTSNAAQYANSLAKKMARAANQEAQKSIRKGVKSNTQRLSEAKARAGTFKTNIAQLTETINSTQKRIDAANQVRDNANQTIRAEQAKQRQLKQEITSLEKQLDEFN